MKKFLATLGRAARASRAVRASSMASVACVVVLAGCGSGSPTAVTFALPPDASVAVAHAGLPMLGSEQLAVHYHVHLDVMVNGATITVPESIGIDQARPRISPLHTHDTTGVIHIESATDVPFTLGQVFDEWEVGLTATQLQDYTTGDGKELRVYVNGKQVTTDPRAIVLHAHDEIFVGFGKNANFASVPSSYAFAPGQ